ncbi:hypothetical protein ALC62_05284, partial [Cyphomyrmex costatus]
CPFIVYKCPLSCIEMVYYRQHVFVNTRRQFALYHRYIWCPKNIGLI